MYIRGAENWLSEVVKTDDPNIVITHIGHLTPALVQAALDKQYGPHQFEAHDHGTVIVINNLAGMRRRISNRLDGMTSEEIERRLASGLSEGGVHRTMYQAELDRRQCASIAKARGQ